MKNDWIQDFPEEEYSPITREYSHNLVAGISQMEEDFFLWGVLRGKEIIGKGEVSSMQEAQRNCDLFIKIQIEHFC